MAASASLTIPVTLASPRAVYDITSVLEATAGVSDLAVDAATSKATLGYQFPGSLDSVMRKLRSRGLSVPVKNLSGKTIDAAQFLSHLNASPAITGANYDGKTVSATIVPMTASMRYVYEEIIIAGLTAVDIPTVAGPQEFVL